MLNNKQLVFKEEVLHYFKFINHIPTIWLWQYEQSGCDLETSLLQR